MNLSKLFTFFVGGSTPEVAPINLDASDDGEDGEVYDSGNYFFLQCSCFSAVALQPVDYFWDSRQFDLLSVTHLNSKVKLNNIIVSCQGVAQLRGLVPGYSV